MGICSSCEKLNEERYYKKLEKDRTLSRVLEKSTDTRSTICRSILEEKSTFKNISVENFDILKILGKGSSGTVYLARKKFPSKTLALNSIKEELIAIKIVEKSILIAKHLQECLLNEKNILQYSECPFIAKLYFSFQSPTKLFFGMEYLSGGFTTSKLGDLFFHLSKGVALSENAIKFYCAEIILAIEYLHKNNVIYRDLKPENLIFDKEGHIKIVDFGLSKFLRKLEPKISNTYCGTPEYVAPEIVCNQTYDKSVDWWSLVNLI